MPYIKKEMRPPLEKLVGELIKTVIEQAEGNTQAEKLDSINGQLNFTFFKTLKEIFTSWHSPSYANYAKALSILECCKLEFYRELVAPYEDKKKKENGEV